MFGLSPQNVLYLFGEDTPCVTSIHTALDVIVFIKPISYAQFSSDPLCFYLIQFISLYEVEAGVWIE
jgi:hypothetical protein